jgi:hypothetical protein
MKHHHIIHTIRCLLATAFAACSLCAALASDQNDLITKLQLSGQLRLDCKAGKARIDPGVWQAADAAAKENFARAIFEDCHSVEGVKSINIYDAQSGKNSTLTQQRADGRQINMHGSRRRSAQSLLQPTIRRAAQFSHD